MAIKGKSKSRGARSVARGPKPAYVPVRTPLIRRGGLWIAVGTAAAAALVAALAIGFVQQREAARERDLVQRMATAVEQYGGQIDPILATVGQPAPPAGFDAFPDLRTTLPIIAAEGVDEAALDQARDVAEETAFSARSAGALIDDIPVTDFLRERGFSREFVLYMIDSRDELGRALEQYRLTALLVTMAIEAEGPQRTELLERADELLAVAEETFARGYADYVEAQSAAEVFEPVAPGAASTG
jgi:hypothetical protein